MSVTKTTTRKGKTGKSSRAISQRATDAVLTEGAKIIATTTEVTTQLPPVVAPHKEVTGGAVSDVTIEDAGDTLSAPETPAASGNDPTKDWGKDALLKCVKDAVKKIAGYLDSGYCTAAYWRLHAALLVLELNHYLGKQTVRQFCTDHHPQINDTMRSRAKKIHKAFPSSNDAGKMPLPKAIAYANEQMGKGKEEPTPMEKLGKKLKGVQERMQSIMELAAALTEEDVAKHAELLDQIIAELHSIRNRVAAEVA